MVLGMGVGGFGALATLPITAPLLFQTSFGHSIMMGVESDFQHATNSNNNNSQGSNNNNNNTSNQGNNNNCSNCTNNGNQTQSSCNNCGGQNGNSNSTSNGNNNNNQCLGGSPVSVNGTGSPSCSSVLSADQVVNQQVNFYYSGSYTINIASNQSLKVQVGSGPAETSSCNSSGCLLTFGGTFDSGSSTNIVLTNLENSNTSYALQAQFS